MIHPWLPGIWDPCSSSAIPVLLFAQGFVVLLFQLLGLIPKFPFYKCLCNIHWNGRRCVSWLLRSYVYMLGVCCGILEFLKIASLNYSCCTAGSRHLRVRKNLGYDGFSFLFLSFLWSKLIWIWDWFWLLEKRWQSILSFEGVYCLMLVWFVWYSYLLNVW